MNDEIKTMYNRQLFILGILSLIIAPLVVFVTCILYKLPFPESISETATISNRSSVILPTTLGALAIFGLTYKSKYKSLGDTMCARIMGIGFLLVALQLCFSGRYIEFSRVGAFALPPYISNIVHCFGALVGFGSLLIWQRFYFTKTSDKENMTKEKIKRNRVYKICSLLTILGIIVFILGSLHLVPQNFPYVFVAEAIILTLAGISCIVKSEMLNILRDK